VIVEIWGTKDNCRPRFMCLPEAVETILGLEALEEEPEELIHLASVRATWREARAVYNSMFDQE
jgi:hypothetical protein